MKTEQEIKDKLIEIYEDIISKTKLSKTYGNQFNGEIYGNKKQIEILEWVLEVNNDNK